MPIFVMELWGFDSEATKSQRYIENKESKLFRHADDTVIFNIRWNGKLIIKDLLSEPLDLFSRDLVIRRKE